MVRRFNSVRRGNRLEVQRTDETSKGRGKMKQREKKREKIELAKRGEQT